MSLLGIDVGTSGTKAVAFDEEGRLLASAERSYPLLFPKPDWIELDSRRVMRAARDAVREVCAKVRRDPVTALAVAAQGEAVTPIDAKGRPLHNAIVTFDARTGSLVPWWEKKFSRRHVFGITGMPLHGMYTASKVLWWKRKRPEIFRKARYFLCFEDLLFREWGLPPTIDASLAARTMLYDVDRRDWSPELLKAAGIDASRLAHPVPSGTIVGEIGANSFGLPRGTKAVAGGHDQPCGALGAGVVNSNLAMYSTGTVECIAPAFSKRVIHPKLLENNIACYPHVVDGLHVALTFNFTGGSLLNWYKDQFGNGHGFAEIMRQASSKPTSLLVLPHFTATGTPHFDTSSKGVIAGLRLSTSRGEVVRSLLEGVTYEMALNVEVLRSCGARVDSFRAIGGGAKSSLWMQIKADILGKPVSAMRAPEAVCFGAAILAGAATGAYGSAREAARDLCRVERTYLPDARRSAHYRERFELYRQLYPSLNGLLHKI